jgi:putative oxidoreductase
MTRHHWISTLARVFCGLVFIMHGYPKIMNLAGTSVFFSENFGVPGWLAIPIAILEFFGGILLVTGSATRIVSALFIFEMLGAMLFVHLPHGWDVFAGGFEFNLALIILLLTVIVLGPGPLSVDSVIARRRGTGHASEESPTV